MQRKRSSSTRQDSNLARGDRGSDEADRLLPPYAVSDSDFRDSQNLRLGQLPCGGPSRRVSRLSAAK